MSVTGSTNYFLQNVNYAEHYSIPGYPFLTSSAISAAGVVEINFPYIPKQVTVTNTMATGSGFSPRVGVTLSGVTSSNYFTLDPQQSMNLNFRTGYLYLSASSTGTFEVVAEVTSLVNFNYGYFQGKVLENLYGTKQTADGQITMVIPKFL